MMDVCVERVKPLGERKHIAVTLEPIAEELELTGDRGVDGVRLLHSTY